MLLPVRPDVEGRPDAVHRGLRHPRRVRHGTAAPVRASAGRLALERLPQQRRDLVVSDGARPSRPAFVVQAREPLRPEALAPLADRLAAGADPLGDLLVVQPFGAQKHDLGAPHEPGGQTARTRQRLELLAGSLTDFERRSTPTGGGSGGTGASGCCAGAGRWWSGRSRTCSGPAACGASTSRGQENIRKRMLVHAAAFNLGLLMRKLYRVGTPRSLQGLATVQAALADRASTAVLPDSSPVSPPYRPSRPVWTVFARCCRLLRPKRPRRHQLSPSRR